MSDRKNKYPNSLENVIAKWRSKTRLETFGVICLTKEKWVSLDSIGHLLGIPPSELLTLIQNDSWFIVGFADGDTSDVWLSINPDREPLALEEKTKKKVARTIMGGTQPRLKKSK